MFRKNYKEAMNDIKPDAAFVESVIKASKKRRPPLHTRYIKYAAAAAAAVIVVSGTVLSMPLWNKIEQKSDGVISEETTITETTKDSETAAPHPAENTSDIQSNTPEITTASEDGTAGNSSGNQTNPSQNNTPASVSGSNSEKPSPKTENENAPVKSKPEPTQTEKINTAEEIPQQSESNAAAEDMAEENADSGEVTIMRSVVMGENDEEIKENKMPADMSPYEEQEDVSAAATAAQADIVDADIPTPTGYRCTSATPRGYTFVNDEGAVIVVTINYGGEEREPYIEENGENIYAVFTSYGLSVTINASGAERESVEEIINSLR